MISETEEQLERDGEMIISRTGFVKTPFQGYLLNAAGQHDVRPAIKQELGYSMSTP